MMTHIVIMTQSQGKIDEKNKSAQVPAYFTQEV